MAHLSRSKERALAAVDRTAVASALIELLAVPSVERHRRRVRRPAPARQASCTRLDLDVDLWPMDLPALTADARLPRHRGGPARGVGPRRHRARGERAARAGAGAAGPRRRRPARRPGAVALRPVRADARAAVAVHARGACDMKAGVVANLAALRRDPRGRASGCAGASRCTSSSARRTAGSARSARCSAATPATPASSPSRPAAR